MSALLAASYSCSKWRLGHVALEFLGHAAGALLGAVGDKDCACALLHQMACGQFAHLARADQEDGAALQRAEDLACQINGDRGDGD